MTTYNTAVANGITLSAGTSPEPARVPKGLIATRAVEVKGGWVGQIIVAEDIIWQTPKRSKAEDAEQEATKRVIERVKGLLI
jgi:hypothetical protein